MFLNGDESYTKQNFDKLRINYLNNLGSSKITNKLTALHYSFVTFVRNN